MDAQAVLGALIELAESVGITVRRVRSSGQSHPGGAAVRLRGREVVFLDPTAATADQVDVLAAALREHAELDDRYLPPEIRRVIGRD